MDRWRVYHFHDTSTQAKIKKTGYIHDNFYLRSDAGNLAAFLYLLRETKVDYYKRIVSTIRLMAPFFEDFVLYPSKYNENNILLNWKEKGSPPDSIFGPHQLSDGTLRMMALVTLLLQPELPELIIVDEPELGLHPYAINVLASLLKSVSTKTQIIVSTQSVPLIDQLEPEDLIVVDREIAIDGDKSIFRRLSTETAPSKRIANIIPEYASEKRVAGPIIAEAIGITKLRQHCYHFNAWLERLEQLE